MKDHEKLEWIHSAIQEAQNGNIAKLETAIELVESVRKKYKTKIVVSRQKRLIGGSSFLFRNNQLRELRTMQPSGRNDFRATLNRGEYDHACSAIPNSGEPFAASCVWKQHIGTRFFVSREKFHTVVRFLCENDLLIRTYGKKSYEIKNCDTFYQECESLWETQCGRVQENENAWREYLLMRDEAKDSERE